VLIVNLMVFVSRILSFFFIFWIGSAALAEAERKERAEQQK
jgi:hypothetical protein